MTDFFHTFRFNFEESTYNVGIFQNIQKDRFKFLMKIIYIAPYCYKSFPIRIFHALSLREGIDSYAIFFKNSYANNHKTVTDK